MRRVVLLAAGIVSLSGVAGAQTVCDHLLPLGLTPPSGGYIAGCAHPYALRLGPGSASSGTCTALDLPECAEGSCIGKSGPSLFTCAMAGGYSCCINVAQSVLMAAGNYTGPMSLGIDQRIASDTDQRAGICYSDYAGNGSRVCNVPLVPPIGNGLTHTEIAGFIRLFVSGPATSGHIPVEFIAAPTSTRSASWGRTKILHR